MANPTDLDNYQFGLNYTVAQGDPEDPNVDWDTMSVISGTGQTGLDQAQYQYESIKAAVDSGNAPNVKDPRVVYAPEVNWRVWDQEEEVTDGNN